MNEDIILPWDVASRITILTLQEDYRLLAEATSDLYLLGFSATPNQAQQIEDNLAILNAFNTILQYYGSEAAKESNNDN